LLLSASFLSMSAAGMSTSCICIRMQGQLKGRNAPVKKRDLVFMILLYATAARLDEILSVKIKQLHTDEKKPYVTIVGKKSGGS